MDTPAGWSLAAKLKHATLMSATPPGYVDLDSHVIFRIDGRSPLSRVLVHWDEFTVPGLHLSLHTPWGITLLGMRAGCEAAVYSRRGVAETIKVESVTHAAAHRGVGPSRLPERKRREPAVSPSA